MKHVLVSLALVAIFAPNTPYSVDNVARSTVITSTLNGMPATDNNQREVHAVVVDMPQGASLSHASPETWGTLPMSDSPYEQSPYEQSPATTVLQVAMN